MITRYKRMEIQLKFMKIFERFVVFSFKLNSYRSITFGNIGAAWNGELGGMVLNNLRIPILPQSGLIGLSDRFAFQYQKHPCLMSI